MEKKWSQLIRKAGYNDFQSPFLREILDTLPFSLFIADLDQRVLFVNQTLLSKIPRVITLVIPVKNSMVKTAIPCFAPIVSFKRATPPVYSI